MMLTLASTDPANPYGGILRWPDAPYERRTRTHAIGRHARRARRRRARRAGSAAAIANLLVWLPEDEPRRTRALRGMASELARLADETAGRQGLLIGDVNGQSGLRTSDRGVSGGRRLLARRDGHGARTIEELKDGR